MHVTQRLTLNIAITLIAQAQWQSG